jgi:DNA-binding NarL/FixJ family response regulator
LAIHDPNMIRILVANLPEPLTQLVSELVESQAHMQIVGCVEGHLEVLVAASTGVDLVIMGALTLNPPPGIASHLLNEFPHLKIVVMSTTDDTAIGYWLGVHRKRINRSTADTLLDGIEALVKATPTL